MSKVINNTKGQKSLQPLVNREVFMRADFEMDLECWVGFSLFIQLKNIYLMAPILSENTRLQR